MKTKSRVTNTISFYWAVLRESVLRFFTQDVLTQSAALAFYMLFSLPSILIIIFWIAARFYRKAAIQNAVFLEIGELVGEKGAQELITAMERINIQEPSWWATAVGIGVLLFTATTVFATMQITLNRIFQWKTATPNKLGIWKVLRDRFISSTMLITITFLYLVSLTLETLISALGSFLSEWIGTLTVPMMILDSLLLDMGVTTVLIAIFFRYLPDAKIDWKDTWFGAGVTAGLIMTGKYLIDLFLRNSGVANLYAAAGSIIVILLWVYYASAIFLFGATFTSTRAKLLSAAEEEGKQGSHLSSVG